SGRSSDDDATAEATASAGADSQNPPVAAATPGSTGSTSSSTAGMPGGLGTATGARSGGQPPPRTPSAERAAVAGEGEQRRPAAVRTGLISGIKSFSVKRVRYANVKGIGIFEGDISLGPVEQLDKMKGAADAIGVDPRLPASGAVHGPAGNVQ